MELAQALQFSYTSVAQEIVCATDTMASLGGTLDRLRAKTARIVCGPSILRSSDVIGRVQETLGARCVSLFAGVVPHAPVLTLEEALGVAREARPEALVSVGGGSTHDTTKGMATLLAEGTVEPPRWRGQGIHTAFWRRPLGRIPRRAPPVATPSQWYLWWCLEPRC
jgi:alcohol dehydrogenase class IV